MLTNTKLLGKYTVLNEIGRGGMGIVYKAIDENLERPVAIKELVISKIIDEADQKDIIERFRREALSAASLNHSNIITIFDVGQQENINFIAMEYLPGITLKDLIDNKTPFNLVDMIEIMIQVSNGLDHAHSKGIVHRDIKPDNIRILEDNSAKIMDFGIAGSKTNNKRITEEGSILGTLGYISPEQLYNSKTADSRADIFSYGAMFYEVFTKKLPFDADTIGQAVMNIMQKNATPIKEIVNGLPDELDSLILKCLEKDPDKRYQKFKEVSNDLTMLKFILMNSEISSMEFSFGSNDNNLKIKTTNNYDKVNNTLISKIENNNDTFKITNTEIDENDFIHNKIKIEFVNTFGEYGNLLNQFCSPRSIFLSENNLLWICDTKNSRVQVFNKSGEFQFSLTHDGMNSPCGLAQDSIGNTYVIDSEDCKVRVFDKENNFIYDFAGKTGTENALYSVSSIFISNDDRIYICDYESSTVKMYDKEGNLRKRINNDYKSPYSISSYKDKLVVMDYGVPKIQIISKEGRALFNFGKRGIALGEFTVPRSVSTDKFGNIYITEKLTHRVQIFDQNGKYLTSFGKKGDKKEFFNEPEGIIITDDFEIFVLDRGNNRVQVFKIVKS